MGKKAGVSGGQKRGGHQKPLSSSGGEAQGRTNSHASGVLDKGVGQAAQMTERKKKSRRQGHKDWLTFQEGVGSRFKTGGDGKKVEGRHMARGGGVETASEA